MTDGSFALIDCEDLERCLEYRWSINNDGYAKRKEGKNVIFLHNFILNLPPNSGVDHANRDRLDNRKENLRIASRSQQVANQSLGRRNTTGFKGVSVQRGLYHAKIKVDGKGIHLGFFILPEQAARAYDAAAIKYFGEFACTNESLGLFKSSKLLLADVTELNLDDDN